MTSQWCIPELLPDKLATAIPTTVYAGDPVVDPAQTLFLWRTHSLLKARGMTLAFYLWDDKLEQLWRHPEHHTGQFLAAGIAALTEPDYSLWRDDPLIVQAYNVYRTRWMGRYWQQAGIPIIPSLNWSDERSFSFCFAGIPRGCPVAFCEARTAGGNDGDRRRFLAGLAEGVRQVQPQHVVIYGGQEHSFWLCGRLPEGPHYTLLASWTCARDRKRRQAARQASHQQQGMLKFTESEEEAWAAEDPQAA